MTPPGRIDLGHGDVIPDFGANPTIVATRDGDSSDPAIWGGRLPGFSDSALIPTGRSVLMRGKANKFGILSIAGRATYAFSEDVSVYVLTLFNEETGILDLRRASGVKHETVIANCPFDVNDPEQWGHGVVNLGTVICNVQQKDPCARHQGEIVHGASSLHLATPVIGWKAGDVVVVPDSRNLVRGPLPMWAEFISQTEVRTLTAVSSDGLMLTLDRSLLYDHIGGRDETGAVTRSPWVGNVSRNSVIRSENPDGVRGHVINLHMAHANWGDVEVRDMGRSTVEPWGPGNTKGRYPLHFHHIMAGMGSWSALGCSVWGTHPLEDGTTAAAIYERHRAGIVIHDSHHGDCDGNTVFNTSGGGICTEEGNETGGCICNNFVSTVHAWTRDVVVPNNRDTCLDIWWEGVAYWCKGFDKPLQDNVACDTLIGYLYFPMGLPGSMTRPTASGAPETVNPYAIPPVFQRNETGGGRTAQGMAIWQRGLQGSAVITDAPHAPMEDYCAWNAWQDGVYNYTTYRIDWVRAVFRGCATGFYSSDYYQRDATFQDCDVRGCYTGQIFSPFGDQTVMRGTWKNQVGWKVRTRHTGNSEDPHNPETRTIRINDASASEWILDGGLEHYLIKTEHAGGEVGLWIWPTTQVFVSNLNGSQTFRLYFNEQKGDYVSPTTGGMVTAGQDPPGGLTNTQWLASSQHHTYHGEIAPADATARAGIYGLCK